MPDVLLVGLVCLCACTEPEKNLWWALGCGLILDTITQYPLLIHTVFFLFSVVILHYLKNTIFSNQFLLTITYLIAGSSLYYISYYILTAISTNHYPFLLFFNHLFFPALIYNIVVLFLLYPITAVIFSPKLYPQIRL